MDPTDIATLVSLLGRTDPGSSNVTDLINTYSGNTPQPGQANPAVPDIIPNPTNQKPQALGLFSKIPVGMLGKSPFDNQGMLGTSPNQGSDSNQW